MSRRTMRPQDLPSGPQTNPVRLPPANPTAYVESDESAMDEEAHQQLFQELASSAVSSHHHHHHHHHFHDSKTDNREELANMDGTWTSSVGPGGPLDALRGILLSGEFSDLTIRCGDDIFKVHRMIVFSQSSVLAGLFIASRTPNTITIPTESYPTGHISKLIEFLYTCTYTQPTANQQQLPTHTALHRLGLHYKIPALARLAAINFSISLRQVCDVEVYFQAIRDVYASPLASSSEEGEANAQHRGNNDEIEDEIRDALKTEVLDAATVELAKILDEPPVMQAFLHLCAEVPAFHVDFLGALIEARGATTPEVDVETMAEGMVQKVLCSKCGPREGGYDMEVQCRGCGHILPHAFY